MKNKILLILCGIYLSLFVIADDHIKEDSTLLTESFYELKEDPSNVESTKAGVDLPNTTGKTSKDNLSQSLSFIPHFILNIIPNTISDTIGFCILPVRVMFGSNEGFGWGVMMLPFAVITSPFIGIYYGCQDTINGYYFWNTTFIKKSFASY